MKKTYISPNMLVVRLAMTQPLALSTMSLSSTELENSSEILTKETNVGDVNVWDSEW